MTSTYAVPLALVATLLSACGAGSPDTGSATDPAGGTGAGGLSGTVTVFAAASLQGSFTTVAARFEQANPGVEVRLNFGASSALANGITQGQPADVFASASTATMDTVVAAGAASAPRVFATNVMAIAVPPANPAGITALPDLARPGVTLAVCQPRVPCGAGATTVLRNASLSVRPVSEESDVKAVLTKVQLGEVDAGLVYVTDVRAAGDKVRGVEIPAEVNASTSYPVAALTAAASPDAARAFTDYVLSPAAASVLTAAGFSAP